MTRGERKRQESRLASSCKCFPLQLLDHVLLPGAQTGREGGWRRDWRTNKTPSAVSVRWDSPLLTVLNVDSPQTVKLLPRECGMVVKKLSETEYGNYTCRMTLTEGTIVQKNIFIKQNMVSFYFEFHRRPFLLDRLSQLTEHSGPSYLNWGRNPQSVWNWCNRKKFIFVVI